MPQTCPLCNFQDNDLAHRLNEFIVHYVGTMDMESISAQVAEMMNSHGASGLANDAPLAGEAAEGGAMQMPMTAAQVREHIEEHMLHPRVKLAVCLRKLLDFLKFLEENLKITDAETGLTTVDKQNVELYLKVLTQVTSLYKQDTHTMMFAQAFVPDKKPRRD